MASLSNVNQLFTTLKAEFSKTNADLKKCGELLEKLKISLLQISYMPTDSKAGANELEVARSVLEIGAEYSVLKKDTQSFERYMSQLKCYYYDYMNDIKESTKKYELLGLNLLFLLSQNRVAEFHTELELLPCNIINTNKFIRYPLGLEQDLMEGRYNKLFISKSEIENRYYNFFKGILLDTVRNEIGACLEKAYERISIEQARLRLHFNTVQEVHNFGNTRKWRLGSDNFYHFSSETPKAKEPIPSVELAEMAISYARELEMIV